MTLSFRSARSSAERPYRPSGNVLAVLMIVLSAGFQSRTPELIAPDSVTIEAARSAESRRAPTADRLRRQPTDRGLSLD